MKPVLLDSDFSGAQWQALNGNATAMAAILRDEARSLDSAECEILARMIERLAEHARGDVGGEVGRPEIAAGNWKVRQAAERYQALTAEGRQKSEAKAIVAEEQEISKRTVENYLKLHREREAQIAHYAALYANK